MIRNFLSHKYIPLTFIVVFLLLTSYFYQNHSFSFHFVDEEDNMVVGSYLLHGERLYTDIFSHHQPVPYLISAALQRAFDPNSIFLLVKRHREFMIFYSFLWALFLVWKFRWKVVPFIVIYEFTKHFLLGQVFLAESLAAYPLVYTILRIVDEKEIRRNELIFIVFCLSLIAFLLSSLWPAVLFALIFLYGKVRAVISLPRFLLFTLLGFLPMSLLLLMIIPVNEYIYHTVFLNVWYYIPAVSDTSRFSWLLAFITPLTALFTAQMTPVSLILRIVAIVFFLNVFIQLQKKNYTQLVFLFFLMGLLHIRYSQPGLMYYGGFHFLPWYAVFLAMSSVQAIQNLQTKKRHLVEAIVTVLLISSVLASAYFAKDTLFQKKDMQRDHSVNYAKQEDFGAVIDALSNSNNTVFVAPIEPLIYWKSQTKRATEFVYYYGWMDAADEFHNTVVNRFADNPPTFFYCDCYAAPYLQRFLWGYKQIVRNGKESQLYILESKLKTLTQEQKKRAAFFGFEIH